jgi:lipoyl(octanoyl) transferase
MIGATSSGSRPSPAAEADMEWRVSPGLTPYPEALAEMEARAAAIRVGEAPELVWLLEHPPLYTAGTSADPAELFNPDGLRSMSPAVAGATPITGPASASSMSCSISIDGVATCADSSMRSKAG